MCDYSLSGLPNRLAVEGERLVAYRFPNGVKGFVSQPDLTVFYAGHPTLWSRIRAWFHNETPCAVCLPPGSAVLLRDLPGWLRSTFAGDPDEMATFLQGESAEYRDRLKFKSGATALLQQLPIGQVADVLSLSNVEAVPMLRDGIPHRQPTVIGPR